MMEKFNTENLDAKLSTPARLDLDEKLSTPARLEGDAALSMHDLTMEVSEKAPPMEVQALEVRDYFIETPELQYENWKEMSDQERLNALGKLEAHIAEISKRPPADVRPFYAYTEWREIGYHGEYPSYVRAYTRDIYVDRTTLGGDSFEDYEASISALLKASRHAYQNYNVYEHVSETNSELVNAWKRNLNGIIGYRDGMSNGSPMGSPRDLHERAQQPVEVDARAFAESVMDKLDLHP